MMKIKFFKIKKSYKKENFKINPHIYWEILVIFSGLSIIVSFVFAYNLFIETNKEDNSVIENNSVKIGNKEEEKIKDALQYFAEREKKSAEIFNSPSLVVDPSL
jgi:hypothetical protein